MLNTELPAKAEQLDNLSKSLVQNEGRLLGVNDSPTFLTPSAAQFDLIYDDLLDALMTGDSVLTPPPMRDYSDVPRSAVTRKSQLSTNVPDSLKPAQGRRSQWPPYSPAPAIAPVPTIKETKQPMNEIRESNENDNKQALETPMILPPSNIPSSSSTSPIPPTQDSVAKRRLSLRRKHAGDDFREYLKDEYLFAAKREYPMSDKLRQLQGLSEQAQYKMKSAGDKQRAKLDEELKLKQKEKQKEKQRQKEKQHPHTEPDHTNPKVVMQAQSSRKASHASGTSTERERMKPAMPAKPVEEPKMKVELAYLARTSEDSLPHGATAARGVHFRHDDLQRKESAIDLHRKASSSTVSTDVSTLETPETPPSVYAFLPNHHAQTQQRRVDEEGMRKSVRTRIAKGLRINPPPAR